MDPYIITRVVLDCNHSLQSSEEDFHRAGILSSTLAAASAVEEKFNLLLENFVEYEETLLALTVQQMVMNDIDWPKGISALHTVNRRLANLMSACRSYTDQVPHDLGEIRGLDPNVRIRFATACSREYDGVLGYRVLEALRNYAQHRGLPISRIARGWRREHPEVPGIVYISPQLAVQDLRRDGGFKAKVLAELEELGDEIDVKHFVREYISGMNRIHADVRAWLDPVVSEAEEFFQPVRDQFAEASGIPELAGLAFVRINCDGTHGERVYVPKGTSERRAWLAAKNRIVTTYEYQVVTSEVAVPPRRRS